MPRLDGPDLELLGCNSREDAAAKISCRAGRPSWNRRAAARSRRRSEPARTAAFRSGNPRTLGAGSRGCRLSLLVPLATGTCPPCCPRGLQRRWWARPPARAGRPRPPTPWVAGDELTRGPCVSRRGAREPAHRTVSVYGSLSERRGVLSLARCPGIQVLVKQATGGALAGRSLVPRTGEISRRSVVGLWGATLKPRSRRMWGWARRLRAVGNRPAEMPCIATGGWSEVERAPEGKLRNAAF